MEAELGTYSQDNKALQFEMEQKELRLAATDKELHQERQHNQDLRVEVKNMKCGLHGALAYFQEPELLKKAVDELRKKYLQDDDGVSVCVCVCVCVCVSGCGYVCTWVWLCVCIWLWVCVCIWVWVSGVGMCVYLGVWVCVYLGVGICMNLGVGVHVCGHLCGCVCCVVSAVGV